MVLESPTMEELTQAFCSKMQAAYFFNQEIKKYYTPGSTNSTISNEVFYYTDATIYEMHSASQMLLQIINCKAKLNKSANEVSWNSKFQSELKKANPSLFDWWAAFNSSPQFHLLESVREYISHRGDNIINIAQGGDQVMQASLAVRFRYYKKQRMFKPSRKSIELLDELKEIGIFLNKSYEELQRT